MLQNASVAFKFFVNNFLHFYFLFLYFMNTPKSRLLSHPSSFLFYNFLNIFSVYFFMICCCVKLFTKNLCGQSFSIICCTFDYQYCGWNGIFWDKLLTLWLGWLDYYGSPIWPKFVVVVQCFMFGKKVNSAMLSHRWIYFIFLNSRHTFCKYIFFFWTRFGQDSFILLYISCWNVFMFLRCNN